MEDQKHSFNLIAGILDTMSNKTSFELYESWKKFDKCIIESLSSQSGLQILFREYEYIRTVFILILSKFLKKDFTELFKKFFDVGLKNFFDIFHIFLKNTLYELDDCCQHEFSTIIRQMLKKIDSEYLYKYYLTTSIKSFINRRFQQYTCFEFNNKVMKSLTLDIGEIIY